MIRTIAACLLLSRGAAAQEPPPPPTPEPPGLQGGPPAAPEQRPLIEQRLLDRIELEDPEAARALAALRQRDPDAYRQKLRELARRFRPEPPPPEVLQAQAELQAVEAQLRARGIAWRQAESGREKKRLYVEIQDLAGQAFDRRLALQRLRIAEMRKRLDQAESAVADHATHRDELVAQFLANNFDDEAAPGNAGQP